MEEDTMTATGIRKTLLALAFSVAAPLAATNMLLSTPANAQMKTGCPNKMAAKCPKNTERVCSKTDSKGCCTASSCVAKKK